MKKIIIGALSLVFAGFLSAQTTTTKTTTEKGTNTTEKSTTTTTTKTVTKSSPTLRKRLVVVNASKVNQASGIVKEDDKSKNIDPSTKAQDGEPK